MSDETALENALSRFASHSSARAALSALSLSECVRLLRELHATPPTSWEAELAARAERSARALDAFDRAAPPFAAEFVAALLELVRARVLAELVPRMGDATAALRAALVGARIEEPRAGIAFHVCVGGLGLEYSDAMQRELGDECNARDIDCERFVEQSLPLLTGDFSFFAELAQLHALSLRPRFPAESTPRALVERYLARSNEYGRMLLEGAIAPQSAFVFPSLAEAFLFNEFGVELVAVQTHVADFLARLSAEPNDDERRLLDLLFEELFLCRKIEEVLTRLGESQMEVVERMLGGDGEATPEQLEKLFSGEGVERVRAAFGSADFDKLRQSLPEMGQFLQFMGGASPR